jgi:hypothetical protein
MSEIQFIRLGNGEEGCLHCEIATLLRLLVQGRHVSGVETTAAGLRQALLMLVDEIEKQLLELGEAGETMQ